MKRTATIFLSYARPDKRKVTNLYKKLEAAGHKPWMDKRSILPGRKWSLDIENAIRNSDFFFACLSRSSVNRRGVIQKEIRIALDHVQEKLDTDTYIVPVRLEDCEVPKSLREFQWVDLYERDGWTNLINKIQTQLEIRREEKRALQKNRAREIKSFKATRRSHNRGKKIQDELILKGMALYQKLAELIYRTRNKAREIIEDLRETQKLNRQSLKELSELRNNLIEFMLNQKYFLDVFGCFDVVHNFKNIVVAFHTVSKVGVTSTKIEASDINNLYDALNTAYYAVIMATKKNSSMNQANPRTDLFVKKKLELYQRLSELAYRSKHKAKDIFSELQSALKASPSSVNMLLRLLHEYQELMFKERYFMDQFSCFEKSHEFKEALRRFHKLVGSNSYVSHADMTIISSEFKAVETAHEALAQKLKADRYLKRTPTAISKL